MKILSLSDIHGDSGIVRSISRQIQEADLVLLTGDLTHFGGREDASRILDEVRQRNTNVLAVSGNCDLPEVEHYLGGQNLSLHGRGVVRDGISFVGLGGSLPAPGRTPNELSERQIARLLEQAMDRLKAEDSYSKAPLPLILVSHQPPKNTVADRLLSGQHVGSSEVRDFIERWTPLLCFTGHIHEGRGTDMIGDTLVVNPGPARHNCFAMVDTSQSPPSVTLNGF
jgi:Icc-related predicted phosphoesterase